MQAAQRTLSFPSDLGGVSNGGSSDNLAAILGGTLPIVIIILIAVTVLLVIMIGYLGKKFYTRHKISNLFDQVCCHHKCVQPCI